jgi:hypothetical protein
MILLISSSCFFWWLGRNPNGKMTSATLGSFYYLEVFLKWTITLTGKCAWIRRGGIWWGKVTTRGKYEVLWPGHVNAMNQSDSLLCRIIILRYNNIKTKERIEDLILIRLSDNRAPVITRSLGSKLISSTKTSLFKSTMSSFALHLQFN